ncbi:gliding motility-associated protein GldE [Taibaiella sp. KBW10]|uniref:gliding motility-associated protein GldE n=1 Tax=Taibaiella sp. KBW10 TaxID=2153357 RepID=UPI000F59FB6F|nr:gliding motility-associated protein GldE [Taibaiella sp. KBW10]RQO29952.1 gliding motility-associated protein GldE [Taibaiella sp. KBW10]
MLILLQAALAASPTVITTLCILVLAILFLASIAAGAEVGFFSLKLKDINYLKTKEDQNSRMIITLLEDPELLLSTLRISKISLAILIILLTNYIAHLCLPKEVHSLVLIGIVLFVSMLLLLLFVEVLPKVYSRQHNMRMAGFSAPIVNILFLTFKGIGQVLVDSNEYKDQKRNRKLEEIDNLKELEDAIEASLGHAASKEEVDIFKGVLKFGNISVKQIMQPRLDVVAIRESWNISKVREKLLDAGYSRLPVYRNNIDEVVGMVFTKDFLPYIGLDNFDWHTLIRPAYYVHQHKLIDDLLNNFREHRVHFAIVVDEFGGTAGIITLEDIMEEIVGDIKDEFDEEEHNFKKINDTAYIFEGRMLINDMCRIMGIPLSTFTDIRGESDSIAGLVLEIAGKFPTINEQISYNNYDFTILAVDKLRIEKVKVEYNID